MHKTNPCPTVATSIPLIGTFECDGRTIGVRSHHSTWQAAKGAYTQRAVSHCVLATTPPTANSDEGLAERGVVN